jgi:acetyl-CoA synthetase
MEPVWEYAERDIIIHDRLMNITESCLDRHAQLQPDRLALLLEDESGIKRYTYGQLLEEVCKFANLLKREGVPKGSRVFIFLPKVPETYISFLGAIRHGSIAAPLFEAFQKEGLELRLKNGEAEVLVTNSELAKRIDKSIRKNVKTLKKILIVDSEDYKRTISKQPKKFPPEMKERGETAAMIFTSSTAGTPVAGVQLSHYALVQQHMTSKLVLALNETDRYWCTAHPGWVTGSVYGIIGPLSVGCSIYVYEGHFDADKWLDFLRRHEISVLYTAPTALRMLKHDVKRSDLVSLKNVCSVGEALLDAVFDFYKGLGVEINDTYWQTETGAMVIASWPGMKKKNGAIGKAIPGITADVVDDRIALKPGWPSMMTGIYKHKKMYSDYFKNGWFMTNDIVKKDKEGYFFFKGRGGDMIKTSGERVSPIEIESILMRHHGVKEAAVIGVPDKMKGEIIKAFIVLSKTTAPSERLRGELMNFVKQDYAGHSYPKIIDFVPSLPKTHSGKIIRGDLRKLSKK